MLSDIYLPVLLILDWNSTRVLCGVDCDATIPRTNSPISFLTEREEWPRTPRPGFPRVRSSSSLLRIENDEYGTFACCCCIFSHSFIRDSIAVIQTENGKCVLRRMVLEREKSGALLKARKRVLCRARLSSFFRKSQIFRLHELRPVEIPPRWGAEVPSSVVWCLLGILTQLVAIQGSFSSRQSLAWLTGKRHRQNRCHALAYDHRHRMVSVVCAYTVTVFASGTSIVFLFENIMLLVYMQSPSDKARFF